MNRTPVNVDSLEVGPDQIIIGPSNNLVPQGYDGLTHNDTVPAQNIFTAQRGDSISSTGHSSGAKIKKKNV